MLEHLPDAPLVMLLPASIPFLPCPAQQPRRRKAKDPPPPSNLDAWCSSKYPSAAGVNHALRLHEDGQEQQAHLQTQYLQADWRPWHSVGQTSKGLTRLVKPAGVWQQAVSLHMLEADVPRYVKAFLRKLARVLHPRLLVVFEAAKPGAPAWHAFFYWFSWGQAQDVCKPWNPALLCRGTRRRRLQREVKYIHRHHQGYVLVRVGLAAGCKQLFEAAHRLLAWAFLGKPIRPSYVVDHKCGNKWCLNPCHLAWVEPAVNVKRAA